MVVRSGGDVGDVRCSGADGDSEWCVNIMVTRVAGGGDGGGGGERGRRPWPHTPLTCNNDLTCGTN